MPAIVTDKLKRIFLQDIFDTIKENTSNYYIAIGRGDQWPTTDDTVPDNTPINSIKEERNLRLALQSAKKVADYSFVVPRFNWTSGRTYSQYDDDRNETPGTAGAENQNPYYVMTDENQVYICLKQSKATNGVGNPSTVQPRGTDTKPRYYTDGYVWKYLYTIGGARSSAFLSANFMPVEYVKKTDAGLNSLQDLQADIRDAAVPKQVLGVEIISNGAGYTSTPTVTLKGNGDSPNINANFKLPSATATVDNGIVTKIEIDSDALTGYNDSTALFGRGFDFCSVDIVGGGATTNATARAVLHGNDSGVGANPVFDLRATSLMFNIKAEGPENGGDGLRDFVIGNRDYRQIALLKDPKGMDSAGGPGQPYTASTGRMMNRIGVSAAAAVGDVATLGSLTDPIIEQAGGFKAIAADVDSDKVYYYQNDSTGYVELNMSDNVTNPAPLSFAVDSYNASDVDIDKFSGEIVYVENRAAIERATNNTDDIKIIITL